MFYLDCIAVGDEPCTAAGSQPRRSAQARGSSALHEIFKSISPTASTICTTHNSVAGPCRCSGMTQRGPRNTDTPPSKRRHKPREFEATGCPAHATVSERPVGCGGPKGVPRALATAAATAGAPLAEGEHVLHIVMHNYHNHSVRYLGARKKTEVAALRAAALMAGRSVMSETPWQAPEMRKSRPHRSPWSQRRQRPAPPRPGSCTRGRCA